MHYGELILPGLSKKEILISTYICHPSMANNELSGPLVAIALSKFFIKRKLKKTLRFLFIPETIGSIAYIYKNIKSLKKNVIGGSTSYIGVRGNFALASISKNKKSFSNITPVVHFYSNVDFKLTGMGLGISLGDNYIFNDYITPNAHLRLGPSKFNIQAGFNDRYVGIFNANSAHLSFGFLTFFNLGNFKLTG